MASNKKNRKLVIEPTSDLFDKLVVVVLAFCSAVLPLLVILHKVDLDPETVKIYTGETAYIDIFNYWKSQFLTISLVLLLIFWMVRIIQKHGYTLDVILLPLGLYAGLAVFSTAFSQYAWVALNGYPDRLEGLYAILCYIFLAFTAAVTLKTEKTRKGLLIAIFASCIILGALGASQYLGADFLKTSLGRHLMVPQRYSEYMDKLTFNFGANVMYTTVYNPNYLGSYSALLLPISIMVMFQWGTGKAWKTAASLLAVAATFILWIGGMSRAGLLGGAFSMLLLIVLGAKEIKRQWKLSVSVIGMCLVLLLGMNFFSQGAVLRELKSTLPSSLASILPEEKAAEEPISSQASAETPQPSEPVLPSAPLVESVTLDNDVFRFATETETIVVKFDTDGFQVFDDNDNLIQYSMTSVNAADGTVSNEIIFPDTKYVAYKLRMINNGTVFTWYSYEIPLVIVDGKLSAVTKMNTFSTKLEVPEAFGFKGHEFFGSSRGYIWSRSIPLMKSTMFLGYGPDTFGAVFPQNEIAAKINWLNNVGRLVDKPHNWYLQLGINTGVLSLLVVLALLAWYVVRSLKIMNEPSLAKERLIHIGILCGVIGYSVAAVFNDSNVSVSPVFWTILGIGLSYAVTVGKEKRNLKQPA